MMEQKFVPFLMHPEAYNDKNRFHELAVEHCACEDCGTSVGWEEVTVGDHEGLIWHNYWVTSEDMEELYCEECWEQSACWEMDDCIECDRPRWINHKGKCEECEGK